MSSEPRPTRRSDAILPRSGQARAIQGAIIFPFNLPPILGLGKARAASNTS